MTYLVLVLFALIAMALKQLELYLQGGAQS